MTCVSHSRHSREVRAKSKRSRMQSQMFTLREKMPGNVNFDVLRERKHLFAVHYKAGCEDATKPRPPHSVAEGKPCRRAYSVAILGSHSPQGTQLRPLPLAWAWPKHRSPSPGALIDIVAPSSPSHQLPSNIPSPHAQAHKPKFS